MNNKIKNIITSLLFSFILIAFFIINIIKKDDDISVLERRHLEKFPKLTINSLFNGIFFEKFDIYANDQFINRDDFRKMKIFLEMNTKNNYNDLYIYNGYIIKENSKVNKSSIDSLSSKIKLIKEKYPNNRYFYMIVPDKNYFVDSDNLKLDYNELISILSWNIKNNYKYDGKFMSFYAFTALKNIFQSTWECYRALIITPARFSSATHAVSAFLYAPAADMITSWENSAHRWEQWERQ